MEPLTINDAIPFGRRPDGTTVAAQLRRKSFVIVGEPDAGKSNGLHVFTAGLLRCPDVLLMGIDLGGAGFIAPWLGPYLDGHMPRPLFDAVAADLGEALFLTDFLLDVIRVRRLIYRTLMRRANSDILPLSPQIPGIYLEVDESAEAVGAAGDPQLQSNLTRINQLGRFVGVRAGVTGVRATTDVIPKPMMQATGARIGMGVASEEELNYLLGWKLKIDPSSYPYPGCGLWRASNSGPPPERFRFYDLTEPERIERIAWACEPWRPWDDRLGTGLDEATLNAVDPDLRAHFLPRWERVLPGLTGEPGGGPVSPARGRAHPGVNPRGEPGSPGGSPGAHTGGSVGVARLESAFERARRVVESERRKARLDVDGEWQRLAAALDDDRSGGGEGWQDAGVATEPRARMRQLLPPADEPAVSGPALRQQLADEGHDVPLTTLYRWLKADAADGGYRKWRRKDDQP